MSGKKKLSDNINELFGRVSGKEKLEMEVDRLQSHLVELEIDMKRMKTQLEKKENLAKQAVAEKQEAQEKLNAANTRIETLEHELGAMKQESQGQLRFRNTENIAPAIMSEYIFQIGSLISSHDTLITAYLAPGQSLDELTGSKRLVEDIDENSQILMERAESSTGLVLFYDTCRMVCEAIAPSLPVKYPGWQIGTRFDVGHLKDIEEKDLNICVLIAHAGESFVGLASNRREFQEHRVIRSSVKAKHSKGGFSQRRFERLREEDIAHHVEKVQQTLEELVRGREEIEYIIAGGDLQLSRHICNGIVRDIPVVEKIMDSRIDKSNVNLILRNTLSCRRYQI